MCSEGKDTFMEEEEEILTVTETDISFQGLELASVEDFIKIGRSSIYNL
jgi:hypothetical protein